MCFDRWDVGTERALFHVPSVQKDDFPKIDAQTTHFYPDVASAGFTIPGHTDFKMSTAGVAHTRSLAFLKSITGGPYFNLEKIWDEHTYFEFGDRSVEKTMATMVQEPYVNHIPTVSLALFSHLVYILMCFR